MEFRGWLGRIAKTGFLRIVRFGIRLKLGFDVRRKGQLCLVKRAVDLKSPKDEHLVRHAVPFNGSLHREVYFLLSRAQRL